MAAAESIREARAAALGVAERIRTAAAPSLRAAVDELSAREPMLGRILGYHLGFNDARGQRQDGDHGGLGGALCLAALAAEMVGADEDETLACAVAFELAKDFTQLQDDIIDHDLMRRERASAWKAFGIPLTLLAANATLTLALEQFSRYGARGARTARHLLAALDTCTVGQAQDLRAATKPLTGADAVSMAEFRTIAGNKTCSLIAASLTLGAVLTQTPSNLVEQLAAAGRHVGLAWQVLDDALDLWCPSEPDGAPSYNDLREGKRNFPIIVALGTDAPERDALLWLLGKPLREERDLREAACLIERAGGRSAAEREVRDQFQAALRTLRALPFDNRARDELIAVASAIGLRGANRTAMLASPVIETTHAEHVSAEHASSKHAHANACRSILSPRRHRSPAMIARRVTRQVHVGRLPVGGDAPIAVQAMTNTDTADAAGTVAQIAQLVEAGAEIVRVTVNNDDAAAQVAAIREAMDKRNLMVPLVGDFHFNGHRLLERYPSCAEALDKYRINPGNVGRGSKHDENFAFMIETACRYGKPVRIGVNWGSLDAALLARMMDENGKRAAPLDASAVMREALVRSALESAARAVELGLPADRIVLSAKVSRAPDLIEVYRELSRQCDYPLHLGLTEAGMGLKGAVSSASALGALLAQGIGDTIRVSLTPEPGGDRAREVQVALHILQSLGLRRFIPTVTSCPGCGRTTSTYFQELASRIETHLDARRQAWRTRCPGTEDLHVAVMGCVVNGPGESRMAQIGISLPGSGERPVAPVYMDGDHALTLRGERIAEDFIALVDDYVAARYGGDDQARQRLESGVSRHGKAA